MKPPAVGRTGVVAPEFLNLEDAARYLGNISTDHLRRSDCPRIHFGTRLVFWVTDLRAFALARRSPPLQKP